MQADFFRRFQQIAPVGASSDGAGTEALVLPRADRLARKDARIDGRLAVVADEAADQLHSALHLVAAVIDCHRAIGIF